MKRAKKRKRKAFVIFRRSGLESDRIIFTEESKNLDLTIKSAKSHYENKLTQQIATNPKRFWNYTRNFTKTKSTVETLIDAGRTVSNDPEKSEILNEYFASVWTAENTPPPVSAPLLPPEIISDVAITTSSIRTVLSSLKPNKLSGPDGIHINVLRNCPDLDQPLQLLFTKSFSSGTIPQDWLNANITPLFKKGSRTSASNYRPIALTSQIVKVFEKCILKKLKPF